jgi:probable rRNA maturation factor
MEIDVQIAPEFATAVSETHLQEVVRTTLAEEGQAGEATLVVTSDQGIRTLNRDYLGVDAPTDVLAFSAREEAEPFVVAPGAETYWGDVIISYPRAVAQAAERDHPVERELDLLVVHGLVHLLGYDHATADDKARMWSRQDAILAKL